MTLAEITERRLRVAAALGLGECEGRYEDACLILSAALSALASCVWPRKDSDRKRGLDKNRFVELWVTRAPAEFRPTCISVPLLISRLRARGATSEAAALAARKPEAFGPRAAALVLNGASCDMPEEECVAACPGLKRSEIRSASYAAVFYKHVRSATSHEYWLGHEAFWNPMRRDASVSYVNHVDPERPGYDWLIYFDIPWVADLVRSLVQAADAGELPRPPRWWTEG